MTDDVNAFFLGSGSPTASFAEKGATYEGTIMDMKMQQAREIKTGKPKTWENGDPVMQAVITIQTDLRDPQIENDNGVRRIFAGSLGMKEAIATAIKKAGAKGLAVGGVLGIKYVRDGEPSGPGMNPPKVYAAKYEAPVMAVGYDEPDEDLSGYSEEPF